jgi:hypothetical protein
MNDFDTGPVYFRIHFVINLTLRLNSGKKQIAERRIPE